MESLNVIKPRCVKIPLLSLAPFLRAVATRIECFLPRRRHSSIRGGGGNRNASRIFIYSFISFHKFHSSNSPFLFVRFIISTYPADCYSLLEELKEFTNFISSNKTNLSSLDILLKSMKGVVSRDLFRRSFSITREKKYWISRIFDYFQTSAQMRGTHASR